MLRKIKIHKQIENQNSCPVCNNPNFKILFKDRNKRDNLDYIGTYVECKRCSLIYLYDKPKENELEKYYMCFENENISSLQNEIKKPIPKWKQILRKIRFRPHSWPLESGKGDKRLLDLGCGDGFKLIEFAKKGYKIWGIDINEKNIKICKKLLPKEHFLVSDLKKLNLPDNYFDYIHIDNTLEHIFEPKKAIIKCYKILKKGGKLLIYAPNGKSFSMQVMKKNSISSWVPLHLQLFTYKSLNKLMENTGFSKIKIYHYSPPSWIPLSIMKWKDRKKRVMNMNFPNYLIWVCYPIGWLASKIHLGEELFIECEK